MTASRRKIVLFGNTDWYLYNFRLSLIRRLQQDGADLLLLSPPGPYGVRLQDLGFRWRALDMRRRSLNPFREIALLASLSSLLRRERPDIVHGFTIKCAVYGALAARFARIGGRVGAINGLGYVFTSSDLRAVLLRWPVAMLMRIAFGGRGSRVVVQNPDDRTALEKVGVKTDVIRLIPGSGVDLQRFRPTTRRRDGRRCRVLMPARLLWDKGIGDFVEAARLLETHPIECLIAGDSDVGNPASVPEQTLEQWRREGVVSLLGHVSDLASVFADVDVVVLPSYREGLPKALIEAAACALPLVTVDVPGCRDVVTDGVDGLLVPARNPRRLAEAILSFATDPQLAARLGAAARAKAIACYDDRIIVAKTIAVYDELATEAAGRRAGRRDVTDATARSGQASGSAEGPP